MLSSFFGNHTAYPLRNLFEGNFGNGFHSDFYYGPSREGILFRNYFTGHDPTTTQNRIVVNLDSNQRYYSVVGNVLGSRATNAPMYFAKPNETLTWSNTTAQVWGYDFGNSDFPYSSNVIFRFGYSFIGNNGGGSGLLTNDANVRATTIVHGNWTAHTNGIQWDNSIADQSIPSSLFHSSKPSWFGSLTWPPYNPTNGSTYAPGSITNIPAGYRLVYNQDPPADGDTPVALASSSVNGGWAPLSVEFDGSESVDPQEAELTYLWDFGDGDTSTEESPVHIFSNPLGVTVSNYVVTLTVSDGEHQANTTLNISVTNHLGDLYNGLVFYMTNASLTSLGWNTGDNYAYSPTVTVDPAVAPVKRFFVNVTNETTVLMDMVLNAPDGGSDSLFVSFDNPPASTNMWAVTNWTSGFESRELRYWPETDQVFIQLSPGVHTVFVAARESDTYLRSFTLTSTNEETVLPATVILSDLTHVFDGNSHAASYSTIPEGLGVELTYDGSSTPPTDAGFYELIGTVTNAGYFGAATNVFVIATNVATVMLQNLEQTYPGEAVTATTEPPGLGVYITYDGNPRFRLKAGTSTVVGVVTNAGYSGQAEGTLVVHKASAIVELNSLSHTYNGSPKTATATTTPPALDVQITYNGVSEPPSSPGSYTVVAQVIDNNYEGGTTNTLTISPLKARVRIRKP
jgi:hypothetical protein